MDWVDRPKNYKGLYGILQLLQGSHLDNVPLKTRELGWVAFHLVTLQLKFLDFQPGQYKKLVTVLPDFCNGLNNKEIKLDVTWSYVKRQTAKMTSEFVYFSSNPLLNHIKIEKCLLLFATNTKIFTLLFKELKTDGKSFIFAVCPLTYDHVTSNLISLMFKLLLLRNHQRMNMIVMEIPNCVPTLISSFLFRLSL